MQGGSTYIKLTGRHKFPALDKTTLAPKEARISLKSRLYCVLKYHIVQNMTQLMQSSEDLDRKIDKCS